MPRRLGGGECMSWRMAEISGRDASGNRSQIVTGTDIVEAYFKERAGHNRYQGCAVAIRCLEIDG
jgi:hypothetical protein